MWSTNDYLNYDVLRVVIYDNTLQMLLRAAARPPFF